jgi:hypothetical protein
VSITKLLLRFAVLYIGLLAVTALIVGLFDLKRPSGFNAVLLMVSTMWVCVKFAEMNGAPLKGAQRMHAVIGMFGIDTAIQVTAALGVARPFVLGPFLFAIGTVAALHLLGIYVGTWAAAKQFAKQTEKTIRRRTTARRA